MPSRSSVAVALSLLGVGAAGCAVGTDDEHDGSIKREVQLPLVTAAEGASGIHPGTAVWNTAAVLPAGQAVRPMPPSTRLAPTPRLMNPENETRSFDVSGYPDFEMPKQLWSSFCAANSIRPGLGWRGRAELQMTLLDKGFSRVDSMTLRTSGNGGNEVDPEMTVGMDVPYDRRTLFVTQNYFEDGASAVSHRWIYGALPASQAELDQLLADAVRACDDSGDFVDGLASQVCILDIERTSSNPADDEAWQHIKRLMIDEIQAHRGAGPFAIDHKIQVSGWFYDRDLGGDGQGQDLVDEVGYYKMNLWSGTNAQTDYADPATFGKMVEFWNKQGGWAQQIVAHRDVYEARYGIPDENSFSWIAPYHEDVMPALHADPAKFDRYYKLRPDVAEGTPIWIFMTGAQGYVLWNDQNPLPWVNSEESFIKGNWRIAQHPEMFTATSQFVTPDVSFDGGVTWKRVPTGRDWLPDGAALSWSLPAVDPANGRNFVEPLNAKPTTLAWNAKYIDPVRVMVRAVVNDGKILIAAQDTWQSDDTATRDIMVRWGAFKDTVRLYGREIALGKASMTGLEVCDDAARVDEDSDGAANCADPDCSGHASCASAPTSHTYAQTVHGAIPDNSPIGVIRILTPGDAGTTASVSLTVDITHTWRGDLTVKLTHGGISRTLFERLDGSADDLKRTFVTPDFAGTAVAGPWTLTVIDSAAQDVGELASWSLYVTTS